VKELAVAITPRTCRAARSLLDWKQSDLAEKAGVSVATIKLFERGKTSPNPATITVLQQAFETAGVEFLNAEEPGVRLRKGNE
jgi:transcriptional regulator with XRE-family HTH domain